MVDSDTKVDEVSEIFFDLADRSRESGNPETWINGTVTVASDDVKLDGLRLHSFNGPLEFAGTDINNFSLLNSYVTGFKGENSVRYEDKDGTASTGWTIDGNLIGGVSGAFIDYVEDKFSSGFKFNNPNETSACGCGESVEITPIESLNI